MRLKPKHLSLATLAVFWGLLFVLFQNFTPSSRPSRSLKLSPNIPRHYYQADGDVRDYAPRQPAGWGEEVSTPSWSSAQTLGQASQELLRHWSRPYAQNLEKTWALETHSPQEDTPHDSSISETHAQETRSMGELRMLKLNTIQWRLDPQSRVSCSTSSNGYNLQMMHDIDASKSVGVRHDSATGTSTVQMRVDW